MAYMRTKFEDSNFSRARDMKKDAKRKIGGDLGWLRPLKVIDNVIIR